MQTMGQFYWSSQRYCHVDQWRSLAFLCDCTRVPLRKSSRAVPRWLPVQWPFRMLSGWFVYQFESVVYCFMCVSKLITELVGHCLQRGVKGGNHIHVAYTFCSGICSEEYSYFWSVRHVNPHGIGAYDRIWKKNNNNMNSFFGMCWWICYSVADVKKYMALC